MPRQQLIMRSVLVGAIFAFIFARLSASTVIAFAYDNEDDDGDEDDDDDKIKERYRQKRSFYDLHCQGIYDKSIFAKVDQICEDCYNIFREPKLHSVCRKNCFNNKYFQGCLQTLILTEEAEKYHQWVDFLGKK